MKKRIPSIILMFTLFLTGAFAANTYQKSINVEYGISVSFNNKNLSMTDVNGNSVQAFVYQGTTYVPIRAVSNAFGADISYDSTSNTAYVYNDFSEICAVVHEMDNILTDYFNIINMELASIGTNTATSDADSIEFIESRINAMYDTLSLLASSDSYNSYIDSVVDDIAPSYSDCLLTCLSTATSYAGYCKNQNSSDFNEFVNNYHAAVDKYYDAQSDIDDFFETNCLWRDLNF